MRFRQAARFELWYCQIMSTILTWYCWQGDISKQIEAELEYPGQIKVSVIRESRVVDYAK